MKKSIFMKIFILTSGLMILLTTLIIGANKLYLKDYYIKKERDNILNIAREIETNQGQLSDQIEDYIQKNTITVSIIDKNKNKTQLNENLNGGFGFGKGNMGQGNNANNFDDNEIISNLSDYKFQISKRSRFNIEVMNLYYKTKDDLIIIIEVPIENMNKSIAINNDFLLKITSVILILGNIIGWIFAKRLVKPIIELDSIAQNIAKLDFSQSYKGHQEDEIGNLGKSINLLSKSLEESIENLKEDLRLKEENIQMRREFISSVSHELKTPIALIQGYAHALLENITLDELKKDEYSKIIIEESNKMNDMVIDLLNLSKLEWNAKKLNIKSFDISSSLDEILYRYSEVFKRESISINIESQDIIFVEGDEELINQAMNNYLSNAIKHLKDPKEIKIRLQKRNQMVFFSVYNTGQNISDYDLDRIWESFFKSDKARTRAYQGTGLGLSIVKEVVKVHRGRYGVDNLNGGVEFYFEIPISFTQNETKFSSKLA